MFGSVLSGVEFRSKREDMNPLATSTWELGGMQVSLFPAELAALPSNSWLSVFGEEPEVQESRPREGFARTAATIEDRVFQILATPVRVDFNVSAREEQFRAVDMVPGSIGTVEEAIRVFSESAAIFISNWKAPSVRIALNSVAMLSHETAEECYSTLARAIKNVRIDPARTRELGYRINHKAKSDSAPAGYINRICSWSAQRVTREMGAVPEHVVRDVMFNALLQLDISTEATNTEILEPDALRTIFHEMLQLAVENIESGEIE